MSRKLTNSPKKKGIIGKGLGQSPLSIVGNAAETSEDTTTVEETPPPPKRPSGATAKQMFVVTVPEHIKKQMSERDTEIETRMAALKIQHAVAEKNLQSATALKKDALLAATRAELSEKTATIRCNDIAHEIQILDVQRDLKVPILEAIAAAHGYSAAEMLPNLNEDGDIIVAVKIDPALDTK